MSDDTYEPIARELQAQPYPQGPQRPPPPWDKLTASSKAYWLARARAGEQPRVLAELPPVAQIAPRPLSRRG